MYKGQILNVDQNADAQSRQGHEVTAPAAGAGDALPTNSRYQVAEGNKESKHAIELATKNRASSGAAQDSSRRKAQPRHPWLRSEDGDGGCFAPFALTPGAETTKPEQEALSHEGLESPGSPLRALREMTQPNPHYIPAGPELVTHSFLTLAKHNPRGAE